MKSKNRTISIRLNEEIYSILDNNSKNNNMSHSEYIRSILSGMKPVGESHTQEIASALCVLYVRLAEMGIEEDEIAQEVYRLCQILS